MLIIDQITVQYGGLMALNGLDLCLAEGTISVIEGTMVQVNPVSLKLLLERYLQKVKSGLTSA